MMIWTMKHPQATLDMLGAIPMMLYELDPRPAREQFDEQYKFAGGWDPFPWHSWVAIIQPNGSYEISRTD
jgi:hypothetical protein